MIRHAVLTTVTIAVLSLAVLGPPVQAQDRPTTQERDLVADLHASAEAGEAQAQYTLGEMYYAGLGVPKDYVEAAAWYRQAAEQGHDWAQCLLGKMYANGEGVPHDDAAAVRWYRLAAEQGLAYAQTTLGEMYLRGEGVSHDAVEAVTWYRFAAEQGHTRANQGMATTRMGKSTIAKSEIRGWRIGVTQSERENVSQYVT